MNADGRVLCRGAAFSTLQGAVQGNITNITDPSKPVIGLFGAVSSSMMGVFVRRDQRMAMPVGTVRSPRLEPPYPPEFIPKSPCQEGVDRTRKKPEGWP